MIAITIKSALAVIPNYSMSWQGLDTTKTSANNITIEINATGNTKNIYKGTFKFDDTGRFDAVLDGMNMSLNEDYTIYSYIDGVLQGSGYSFRSPVGFIQDDDIYRYADINSSKIRHYGSYWNNILLSDILDDIWANLTFHAGNYYNKSEINKYFYNKSESKLKFLNLSGTNANQNINISPYDFIANNITSTDFFFGQPLDGSIGSGIINSSSNTAKCGSVNVTDKGGLTVSYPSMIVRLVNLDGTTTHCYIQNNTITVNDNQHSVYYVDSDCSVKSTTWANFFDKNIKPSNFARIFDVYATDGDIEVLKGSSLLGLKGRRLSWVNVNCGTTAHLGVCNGIDVVEDAFPVYNQTSGHYNHIDMIVTSNKRETDADGVHFVYRSGGAWTHSDDNGINLTHCDDGTNLITCSNNKYRRYFVGSIGCGTHTKIHQLAALDSKYFNNIGDCLNVEKYPLSDSYTMPDGREGVFLLHHVYCGQRDDTGWNGDWIDLRDGGIGAGGGIPDLSGYLRNDEHIVMPTYNATFDYVSANYFGSFGHWFNLTFMNTTWSKDTDTTIGNCSITGSCQNNAYMNYSNIGNMNVSGNYTSISGFYCNSTHCKSLAELAKDETGGGGSGGNPFDQSLNTTDNVSFANLNISSSNSEINIFNLNNHKAKFKKYDNNELKITNEVYKIGGDVGTALDFDGSTGYVNCSNDPSSDITGKHFTVMAWVKPDFTQTSGNQYYRIFGNDIGYLYFDYNANDWVFLLYAGGSYTKVWTKYTSWSAGTWHHIAGTYDGSRIYIYWDGDSWSASRTGDITTNHLKDLIIGWRWNGNSGDHFPGTIDEIVFMNKTLSSAEISDYYNGGEGKRVSVDNDVRGLYHFDEGSGDITYDATSYGNDGVLKPGSGEPSWVTGKIKSYGKYTTVDIISSRNGTEEGNDGIITFGDDNTTTQIHGKTVNVSPLFVDNVNDRVGINNENPAVGLDIFEKRVLMTYENAPDSIVYVDVGKGPTRPAFEISKYGTIGIGAIGSNDVALRSYRLSDESLVVALANSATTNNSDSANPSATGGGFYASSIDKIGTGWMNLYGFNSKVSYLYDRPGVSRAFGSYTEATTENADYNIASYGIASNANKSNIGFQAIVNAKEDRNTTNYGLFTNVTGDYGTAYGGYFESSGNGSTYGIYSKITSAKNKGYAIYAVDKVTSSIPHYAVYAQGNSTFNGTINVNDIINKNLISSANLSGKIKCTDIYGSPDTDFCTDATGAGGGGSGTNYWKIFNSWLYPNTTAWNVGNITNLNATNITSDRIDVDNGVLYADPVTDRVGVNTKNPSVDFEVTGEAKVSSYFTIGTTSVLGTCNSANRNKLVCVNGMTQIESDKCYICLKSSGGVGQWSIAYDFGEGLKNVNAINNSGLWVPLGDGTIWYSSDGSTWTQKYDTGATACYSVGGNGTNILAGCYYRSGTTKQAKIYNSSDGGTTWGLDHTFNFPYYIGYRILGSKWADNFWVGLSGTTGAGDLYSRNNAGSYTLSLDTSSTHIVEVKKCWNGYLCALSREGKFYMKQNAFGMWTNTWSGTSTKYHESFTFNGTVGIITGGNPPFVYSSTDGTSWTSISTVSWINTGYDKFLDAEYFGGAWYFATRGDGDVLKYQNGKWSRDLDTNNPTIYGLEVYNNILYAAAGGTVDVGYLYRLSSGLESYSWKKIAEG